MTSKITKRVGRRGISYQVMVELPRDPITGKRRQKLLTADTKKEAEALAAQTLVSIQNGGFAEADAKRITVNDYLTRWLESMSQTIRPTSHRRYTDMVRQHIAPSLGRLQLSKLSPLDVQKLYADKHAEGLSPTTVSMIHGVLHTALKQAVRWGLLTRNVTDATDAPRRAVPAYNIWNESQVAAFLTVSDQDSLAALWRMALLTGMRRGEILGLKWEDVDFGRRVLAVQRTLSRGPQNTYTFGVPKSAKGRRAIAIPQSVVDSLRKHRARQAEKRWALGTGYQDEDMVFATPLGAPLHPNTVISRFNALIARAGVPRIRFHDLRHTSATLMLANGEHPKIVQERLGHADISMTLNRYSHVTMDMQREAADRLDALIDGAS